MIEVFSSEGTPKRQPALEFVRFAIETGVLRFGEFITKAGRLSPYFFNAGLFNSGYSLGQLCGFYAERLLQIKERLDFDMLFGPAYKGIPLVATTAVALARQGLNLPFAFNRKEAKDHGEKGTTIGAPLKGRVLIIDDVISAGTSVRESVEIIRAAGAEPTGVLIALDRQERGLESALSAVQEVKELYGIPVFSIATLDDILGFLSWKVEDDEQLDDIQQDRLSSVIDKILAYKTQYGVAS